MSTRWWVESKDWRKVALFTVLLAIAVWLCLSLPSKAYRPIGRTFGRRGIPIPLPVLMLVLWSTGWFFLLFIRVEDTSMLAPTDYTGRYRFFSVISILAASALAVVLYLTYFYRG